MSQDKTEVKISCWIRLAVMLAIKASILQGRNFLRSQFNDNIPWLSFSKYVLIKG